MRTPGISATEVWLALFFAMATSILGWSWFAHSLNDFYDAPVAGLVGLIGQPKAPDLAAFKIFIVGFAAALATCAWRASRRGQKRVYDRRYEDCVYALIGMLGIVACAYSRVPEQPLRLAYLAPMGAWMAWKVSNAGVLSLFLRRLANRIPHLQHITTVVRDMTLYLLCVGAAGLGLGIAASRGCVLPPTSAHRAAKWFCFVWGSGGIAMLLAACRHPGRFRATARVLTLATQMLLPAAALGLLPPPAFDGVLWYIPYARLPDAYIGISVFMVCCYLGMAWQCRALRGREGGLWGRPALLIGAWCAIIPILCTHPSVGQSLSVDDYHFGEAILPWQQWRDFGLVPYIDLIPSHGITQFLGGFLADRVFDGSAIAIGAAARVLYALSCVVFFAVLATTVGCGWSLLMIVALTCVPLPIGRAFFTPFAFLLACTNPDLRARPRLWLAFWLAVAPWVALSTLVQGTACMLGSAVLAYGPVKSLWIKRGAWQTFIWVLGIAMVFVGAAVLTGVDKIFLAALRHVRESSSINAIAYGLPLSFGREHWFDVVEHEILKNWQMLWIPAVALLGVGAWCARMEAPSSPQRRLAGVWAAVAVALAALSTYALGRIDPNQLTRNGFVTLFMLTLVIPVSVLMAWREARPGLTVALLVMLAFAGGDGIAVWKRTKSYVRAESQHWAADETGLNIGACKSDPERVADLQSLRTALSDILAPNETYLDLTNRNAQYFYLNRRVPLSVGAFYNAPGPAYQQRVLAEMAGDLPPVVLISASNQLFDGLSPALRTPHLYRYFASRYVPVLIDHFAFLIEPERAARVTHRPRLSAADITDKNWVRGISVYRGGFVASPPGLFGLLRVGDEVVLAGSGARRINEVDGERIWLDGGLLDPERDGPPHAIGMPPDALSRACDPMAILDQAFRPGDLGHLPAAWGKSAARICKNTMTARWRPDLSDLIERHTLDPNQAGVELTLDTAGRLGMDLPYLKMSLACSPLDTPGPELADLHIDWRTRGDKAGDARGISFKRDGGEFLVPLHTSPRWLLSGELESIRIQLPCKEVKVHEIVFLTDSV